MYRCSFAKTVWIFLCREVRSQKLIHDTDFYAFQLAAVGPTLCEKCLNTEFFMARIFLYSDWIQENTDQKKFRIWTLFTQSQHFPFLVFETMLCFLLCSINCEHAATTQRAPIFFVSISLLLPILLPHVVCLYFIKNFFWSSVFKFVI